MQQTNVYHHLRTLVIDALQAQVSEGFLPNDLPLDKVAIELAKDPTHGDFATNAALMLAKPAGKNPRDIAQKLSDSLASKEVFKKIDIAGPGFVNFTLNHEAFEDQIRQIIAQGTDYGTSLLGNNTNVMVEFISANPTGPMHIGHGRNAVVGSTLANLLEKAGYKVTREYLMNDAGGQIRTITKSVHLRYLELFGKNIELPKECYPGEYVIDIAQKLKDQDGDKWLSVTDDEEIFKNIRAFCTDACMAMIKSDLTTLNINFDVFHSEYAMHQAGETEKAVDELREKGFVYEGTLPPPKGKEVENYQPVELTLFKSTNFGEEVDDAIYKPNGDPTYFGQDIAYHINKLRRNHDWLINVWGADHAGAVKRIQHAVEAYTGKKDLLKVILMQMVRLVRDGQPVKMSKRAGTFVTLEDVLDEVGPDAFRFLILTRKADAQMDFDMAKAVEQNNDNPVFYVQYAHARMCAVQRQQAELGIADAPADTDLSPLTLPQEAELMKVLCHYPMMIERAASSLEPHRIAFYAQDLAAKFHSWYTADKFLQTDNLALTHARLTLLKATQIVLQNVLHLAGVKPVEKM